MGFEFWGASGVAEFMLISLGALYVFGMLVNVSAITSRLNQARHQRLAR